VSKTRTLSWSYYEILTPWPLTFSHGRVQFQSVPCRSSSVEEQLTSCGVDFELAQPVGVDTAENLLTAMDRPDAELLVIGIRHRNPVGKLLLGSISQRVILEGAKPVLAAKPDED
jgi:hypothetical protein